MYLILFIKAKPIFWKIFLFLDVLNNVRNDSREDRDKLEYIQVNQINDRILDFLFVSRFALIKHAWKSDSQIWIKLKIFELN
jgi:hypothetical protein